MRVHDRCVGVPEGFLGLPARSGLGAATVRRVSLPSLFSGPPSDRTTFIEQHAVPFSPAQWLKRLPEPWMFDLLAGYQAADGAKWGAPPPEPAEQPAQALAA